MYVKLFCTDTIAFVELKYPFAIVSFGLFLIQFSYKILFLVNSDSIKIFQQAEERRKKKEEEEKKKKKKGMRRLDLEAIGLSHTAKAQMGDGPIWEAN